MESKRFFFVAQVEATSILPSCRNSAPVHWRWVSSQLCSWFIAAQSSGWRWRNQCQISGASPWESGNVIGELAIERIESENDYVFAHINVRQKIVLQEGPKTEFLILPVRLVLGSVANMAGWFACKPILNRALTFVQALSNSLLRAGCRVGEGWDDVQSGSSVQ